MKTVVVIGAGISGLSCAFHLKRLGINVLVLEAQERPGGLVASAHRNGFLFESGPQCPRFPAALCKLVRDLDLEKEFVAGPPRPKRYILRDGRLHSAPFSPAGFVATGLVGIGTKLRIFADVLGFSQPPDREETLAEFVGRKFGRDVLDNLVDPIVSTVFFGDPYRMGMESAFPAMVAWEREHGSVSRGAIRARRSRQQSAGPRNSSIAQRVSGGLRVTEALPSLGSFRLGMGTLTDRIASELGTAIRYKTEVTSLVASQSENGPLHAPWRINLSNGEQIQAEHLVLSVPAYVSAELLRGVWPQLASQLRAVEYAEACVVGLAYNRSQVGHSLDGFGFMVPRREAQSTICTFWNSSLFAQRAPAGKVVITSFARDPDNVVDGGRRLIRKVEEENARVLAITGAPLDRMFWFHPRALPQYAVGHARRVMEINDGLRSVRNLHLIGNYLNGRSVGECVETAERVARSVHECLQKSHGAAPRCTS